MNQLDSLLTDAMTDLAGRSPHDDNLASTIRRRSRWRRAVLMAPIAAALAVIVVAGVLLAARPARPSSTPAGAPSACSPVPTAVLPTWARAGFTDSEPEMPYVTSSTGVMVAIIFAPSLVSPPLARVNNKILWVAQKGLGTLTIRGTVEGGTETMLQTVEGGPGPSIIDVPVPGCWHFDLTWGDQHDSVDLRYAPS